MTAAPNDPGSRARTTSADTSSGNRGRVALVAGLVTALVLGGGIATAAVLGPNAEVLSVIGGSPQAEPNTPAPAPAASTPPAAPTESAAPSTAPTAAGYDITSVDSLTVLVNKRHPLNPQNYVPANLVRLSDIGVPSLNDHSLRKEAAEAIKEMYEAAKREGIVLDVTSGYRSYELQEELYTGYVADMGQEAADLTSARPGTSEHQTGLAADISAPGESDCILTDCFENTKAGQWLFAHAAEYGWILRYPKDVKEITGYGFEAWHFRFLGKEVASAYVASGARTYEEFLGVEPAPDYGP